MSGKSCVAAVLLTLALVALGLCEVPAATATSPASPKTLRFTVVKHAPDFDVVKGHHHRFTVRRGARKVVLHGNVRYRVVKRTHRYIVLRAVPTIAPLPGSPGPDPAHVPLRPCRPSPSMVISVRDYGAVGDGVTDDYDAIQSAIDACSTTGGEVVFPAGRYYLGKRSAGGLKLPAENADWLVLSGTGATIRLSANVPRFLDFNRTADHQTFAHFWVEGFAIDADHVASKDHVVGFSYIDGQPLRRINVEDVVVRDVHAYNVYTNIYTDTSAADWVSCREGISIATYQRDLGEATTNTIKGIYFESVRIEGGNVGFMVGGVNYAGVGWPAGPADTNIEIDDVRLDDCSWDSGVRSPTFWRGNGMHMGWGARCGDLYVSNCDFRGSGDNNFEVNAWRYAYVQNCVSEDAYGYGYFFSNLGWPIGGVDSQQITWKDCIHRKTYGIPSDGWAFDNTHPIGALTLEGCSASCVDTGAAAARFLTMRAGERYTLKSLTLRNCDSYATGLVASSDGWPSTVLIRGDGAPSGGSTSVTVEGCQMFFRSTRVGTPAYVARLMEIGGSNVAWVVRDSLFDAAIAGGDNHALRVLGLGDAFASKGSGVVDRCTFRTNAVGPWAVRVGDSTTLTIDGSVDAQNCDFTGVNPGGTPIYLTPGDPNGSRVRLLSNTMP